MASVAASTDSVYEKTIKPTTTVTMTVRNPKFSRGKMSPKPVADMVTTVKYTATR